MFAVRITVGCETGKLRGKRHTHSVCNSVALLGGLGYLSRPAVQVDHVDFVPISHPQTSAFGEAAANRLHGVRSKSHHIV